VEVLDISKKTGLSVEAVKTTDVLLDFLQRM
jgi:hypothetical protein